MSLVSWDFQILLVIDLILSQRYLHPYQLLQQDRSEHVEIVWLLLDDHQLLLEKVYLCYTAGSDNLTGNWPDRH